MSTLLSTSARVAVAVVVAATLVAGCGSDDDADSNSSTDATVAGSGAETAGSYVIVSDAAVAQGYAEMIDEMTALSGDPAGTEGEALEDVREMWLSFEGTVKQQDPESYLASEEALNSFLEGGDLKDGAMMATATAKMSETAATYLAAHPG